MKTIITIKIGAELPDSDIDQLKGDIDGMVEEWLDANVTDDDEWGDATVSVETRVDED